MRYDGRGGRSQDRTESRVNTSALADVALLAVPVVLVVAASYPALAAGVVVGAVAAYAGGRIRTARAGRNQSTEGAPDHGSRSVREADDAATAAPVAAD